MEIEPDARHVEVALNDLGLASGNSIATPAVKVTAERIEQEATLEPLSSEQSTLFRSVLMKL